MHAEDELPSKATSSDKPDFIFSSFLLDVKQQYLTAVKSGRADDWIIVMGNEAGGMFSFLSARDSLLKHQIKISIQYPLPLPMLGSFRSP